jgi:sporulation integral membrane protein YtvI
MEQRMSLKIDRVVLYTVIYIVLFISLWLAMPYILPFVLGTVVALLAQPLINFITRKTRMKRGLIGLIVVLIIFAIITAIITLIIVKIVNELISLSAVFPDLINWIKTEGYKYIDAGAVYFKSIDPSIIESIKDLSNKIFSGSFTAALSIVSYTLNVLKSLPGLLMVILFTLLSSVYIAIDFPRMKEWLFSLLYKEDGSRARKIIYQANRMIGNYAIAYMTLITITFIETLVGLGILHVKYAVLISIVTSISDLLPILGPGTVLVPTGVILILSGDLFKGIGILVLYIIITIIRQILEPKVVSTSLGIHPLAIIAAIFIGLKAYGFVGMIFMVFYVVFYVILRKVEVL